MENNLLKSIEKSIGTIKIKNKEYFPACSIVPVFNKKEQMELGVYIKGLKNFLPIYINLINFHINPKKEIKYKKSLLKQKIKKRRIKNGWLYGI